MNFAILYRKLTMNFLDDGVTKIINKEDFRDFCKFISQTHDEFIRAEDEED